MTRPPVVRFDSLDPLRGARSFAFRDAVRTLQARAVHEVVPLLREVEAAATAGMHGVGFLAYEAAPAFDPALVTRPPAADLPLAWFAIFRDRFEQASPLPESTAFELGDWAADVGPEEYRTHFEQIRGLLAAGETYQVNYTFRLRASFAGDPEALYARLCGAQRSAFCAFLDLGTHAIASASPELFFHWRDGVLTLRPMKGTRPRGRWAQEDAALAQDLSSSAKERAENLMIVDLLRNDAGRVAIPGTVRVHRLFEVEHYDTVHQLTSTLSARTRPEITLVDVFRGLFPCGSVTGAPKVRTMEIIRSLEASPRGVYCGAIGVVSPGEAVFSVGIRTVVVDRVRGEARLGVGSGITWDARPADEYRECLEKAAFAAPVQSEFELLETLLHEPGSGFFLLAEHLDRIQASAVRLGFACSRPALLGALHQAVAGAPACPLRVRLVLHRSGRVRASAASLESVAPLARVALSTSPVDPRDPLLFHKTTRREPYERRRAEHPDADEVLLVNERGEVTEGTIASLVVKLDGGLWTPAVGCGLLPGTFRAELLRRGDIAERLLLAEDLSRAESLWLISSLRRWRRAELLQPRPASLA